MTIIISFFSDLAFMPTAVAIDDRMILSTGGMANGIVSSVYLIDSVSD